MNIKRNKFCLFISEYKFELLILLTLYFMLLINIIYIKLDSTGMEELRVLYHIVYGYKVIIFAMLIGTAATITVILITRFGKNRTELIIFTLIVMAGTIVAWLSPVMSGFDEPCHFFKAAATLDGKMFDYSSYSYEISDSVININEHAYFSWSNLSNPWKDSRTYIDVNTIGYAQPTYPFWGYLFCCFGLLAGEILKLSEGISFLLGRLFNVIGFAAMILAAMCLLPKKYTKLRTAYAAFGLFPGTIFVIAHYTQESVVYGLVGILISLFFRMYANEEGNRIQDYILFSILFLLLVPLKYPYIFIGFLLFMLPGNRKKIKFYDLWVILLAFLSIAVAGVWLLKISSQFTETRVENVNGTEQLLYILKHPLKGFVSIFITEFGTMFTAPVISSWVTANGIAYYVSKSLAYIQLIMMIPAMLFASTVCSFRTREKLAISGIVFAIYLATGLALYASFNTVGTWGNLEGIQPRYFYPLNLLIPILMPERFKKLLNKNNNRTNRTECFTLSAAVAACASWIAAFGMFL